MISCFLFINNVNAASYYGISTGSGVNIRSTNSTSGSILATASTGQTFDLVSNTLHSNNGGCSDGWYQIYYNGSNTGYICATYFNVYEIVETSSEQRQPVTECEIELANAGFPSSYWNGLCTLKAKYPNWTFNAVTKDVNGNTLDWNVAINAESSCGKNVISSTNAYYTDSSCTASMDPGYYPASKGVVRYYMDPRNFFNEVNIFMFENGYRNNSISSTSYTTLSTKIFNNNFLVSQISYLPTLIDQASSTTNISAGSLASRIRQELGAAKVTTNNAFYGQLASVVSGNYTSRYPEKLSSNGNSLDNYYNFFNVNATDGSDTTQKALQYAFNNGWGGTGNQYNDRQLAITGGANFLKTKYYEKGQYSIYFQKFNVFPTVYSSRFLNQYMTNIQAPKSESSILYSAYSSADLLNSNFVFYIPVYQNMNSVNNLPTSDADNGDIVVVPPGNTGENSVNTIVTASGFRYSGSYISAITPNTTVDSIKNSLEGVGGSNTVTITDANGNAASGKIGTGYKITIRGNSTETLTAIIYGDTSGDGIVNALDLLKVQKHILGSSVLSGAYKEAADSSKDGKVNALDLLKVQKHILGSALIGQ